MNINTDVVLIPYNCGVIASNYRAHSHIWLNSALLLYLLEEKISVQSMSAANMSRFSNIDGLLADPTGIDYVQLKYITFFDKKEAIEYLKSNWIIESSNYHEFINKKTSILDNKHLGTFHQNLGQALLLKEKLDPELWWYNQKFNNETGEVKDNLYKYIQEKFIKKYFKSLSIKEANILDFGCGTGMASREFIGLGANNVYGVDPDLNRLKEATELSPDRFTPIHIDIRGAVYLNDIVDINETFDLVWISDVFHFYFYPMDGGSPKVTGAELLEVISPKLRSGGKCVIMLPHGVFWLSPWLGSSHQPFTVITEYSRKLYSVVPTLSEITQSIAKAGLVMTNIFELYPEGHEKESTPTSFASEFPLWWVFECEKR